MMKGMSSPGQVWAHVGQPFKETEFDVVVVGAGRMGAALALYLRQQAPHLSVLMVEEGGLPNEEGATLLAPGVWTTLNLPDEHLEHARWTREQLHQLGATQLGATQLEQRPLIELSSSGWTGSESSAELAVDFPVLETLVDLNSLPHALIDREAVTYRPGSVALNAAQQAIGLGANLLLNTRACLRPTGPGSAGLSLERLTVTNTHQIVTHEVRTVRATTVVVAAGAAGPALVEHGLGVHTRHGRAYQQYPRLDLPSLPDSPVVRVQGLTLRPQQGAFTLIPAIHHRDPHGYVPGGGHLTGVPTGLRREVLEDLVNLMDSVPALAGEALQVGRSLSDLPGAWVALPHGQPGAAPQWEDLGAGHVLLLGGPLADTLGLAVAHDLALHLARDLNPTPHRPTRS